MSESVDNAVIGGGIYGVRIATALAEAFPMQHTVLFEAESELMARASDNNHNRLHLGYQYPLHPDTAQQSKRSAELFIDYYPECVDFASVAYYGIHKNSPLNPAKYQEFLIDCNLPFERTKDVPEGLFGDDIAAIFATNELTFSGNALKRLILEELDSTEVDVRREISVDRIEGALGKIAISSEHGGTVHARRIFNCSYASVNALHSRSSLSQIPSVFETTVLIDVKLPEEIKDVSATVLYGEYASIVSSGRKGSHILGHVAYSKLRKAHFLDDTSHQAGEDDAERVFKAIVDESSGHLPVVSSSEMCGYISEVKCMPGLDPSLGDRKVGIYENFQGIDNYHVVIGGKVSSFFDAEEFALGTVFEKTRLAG